MSNSQFEKRRAKAEAAIKPKKEEKTKLGQGLIKAMEEIVDSREMLPATPEPSRTAGMTYEGYDVYLTPDKKEYRIVIFKYDPVNQNVIIEKIEKLERGLALNFENRKSALKQLIKRK